MSSIDALSSSFSSSPSSSSANRRGNKGRQENGGSSSGSNNGPISTASLETTIPNDVSSQASRSPKSTSPLRHDPLRSSASSSSSVSPSEVSKKTNSDGVWLNGSGKEPSKPFSSSSSSAETPLGLLDASGGEGSVEAGETGEIGKLHRASLSSPSPSFPSHHTNGTHKEIRPFQLPGRDVRSIPLPSNGPYVVSALALLTILSIAALLSLWIFRKRPSVPVALEEGGVKHQAMPEAYRAPFNPSSSPSPTSSHTISDPTCPMLPPPFPPPSIPPLRPSRKPVAEGAPWRSWCISLTVAGPSTSDAGLPGVREVRYLLHGSFDDPVRRLTEEPWDIEEVGWGGFDIPITLVWNDPRREDWSFVHRLSFDKSQYTVELDVPERSLPPGAGSSEEEGEEGVEMEDKGSFQAHFFSPSPCLSLDPDLVHQTDAWELLILTRNRILHDRKPVDPSTPWRRWRVELIARHRGTNQLSTHIPRAAEVSCILHPSLGGSPRRRWESPPYVIEEEGWGGFWIPFRVVWDSLHTEQDHPDDEDEEEESGFESTDDDNDDEASDGEFPGGPPVRRTKARKGKWLQQEQDRRKRPRRKAGKEARKGTKPRTSPTILPDWRFQHNLSFDQPAALAVLSMPGGMLIPEDWSEAHPSSVDPPSDITKNLEIQTHATRLAHLIARLPSKRQHEIVHLIKREEDPASEGLYLAEVGAGEVQLDIGSMRRRVRLMVEARVEEWMGELRDEIMGWEGREQCLVDWEDLSR
ncbi:hypothetical protein BJ684DRAFT_20901 [Piptocephalis cylindrospora]|uniref:Protein AF-9 homolog n=1 Tax=Piptocephalis cylindrospora TaxID=1907219 RepID=A0A4P9Y1A9_9FUNG|nr:hypothetical protein BJ684DRAFT_20901 [Piptocephalis cylindrospora]|eukprot:RKP12568.1 hypothetical protein BJ684DRAFT_20901 [Piptocephalis cylindrospora]